MVAQCHSPHGLIPTLRTSEDLSSPRGWSLVPSTSTSLCPHPGFLVPSTLQLSEVSFGTPPVSVLISCSWLCCSMNSAELSSPSLCAADVPAWLKSLRLHKYAALFSQMTYEEMMALTECQLEAQVRPKAPLCVWEAEKGKLGLGE